MPFEYSYSVEKVRNVANVSPDRILKLKPNLNAKNAALYLNNNLHAVQDSGLWYLKLDRGAIPSGLQMRWTNFNQLLKYVTTYFKSKDIDVEEIIS
jgi:hypothetical protein